MSGNILPVANGLIIYSGPTPDNSPALGQFLTDFIKLSYQGTSLYFDATSLSYFSSTLNRKFYVGLDLAFLQQTPILGWSLTNTFASFHLNRFNQNGVFLNDQFVVFSLNPNTYLSLQPTKGTLKVGPDGPYLDFDTTSQRTTLSNRAGEDELILGDFTALKRDANNYLVFNSDGEVELTATNVLKLNADIFEVNGIPTSNLIGVTGLQGVQGIQGGTGIRGRTGWKGVTGLRGRTGLKGPTGVRGLTGVRGRTGITGRTGVLGRTGLRGITGFRGVTGILGLQGSTGIQGKTGLRGRTGLQGKTGLKGLTGFKGITGLRGRTGFRGATGVWLGITGIQGKTGLRGRTGLKGQTGVRGPTGIRGITGLRGRTGLPGNTGIKGPTGVKGLTGVRGLTGIKGPTGIRGVTGIKGPTGIQGITGLQGVTGVGVTGINGATGVWLGITGPQGITGLQGLTGIHGVGLTGLQGIQGQTGIQGVEVWVQEGDFVHTSFEGSDVIVSGTLIASGGFKAKVSITAIDTVFTSSQFIILVDASGGSRTVYVPQANLHSNRVYIVKRMDTSINSVTLQTFIGTDKIFSTAAITSIVLGVGTSYTLVSDGVSRWYIISSF